MSDHPSASEYGRTIPRGRATCNSSVYYGGYYVNSIAGSPAIWASSGIGVPRHKCSYCGRAQKLPENGGCVGCGAPL